MKFQNIPMRTEVGRRLRAAFGQPVATSIDYTTVEMSIMSQELIAELLKAPDSQLDASLKPFIVKWGKPPTALQVLEVLDYCVNGSLASGFVVRVLEMLLSEAIKREDTTYEAVVVQTSWRVTTQ
jgi:hypothetical protein